MAKQWPAKGPNEKLRSGVDWAPELGDDTISTSVFTLVNAAGLAIVSQSNTETTTTVVLSGGTAGGYGVLLNSIVTAAGDELDETIYIPIVDEVAPDLTLSYATLTQADAYAAARTWTDWSAATVAAKAGALLQATAYLDATYRWPGTLYAADQTLGWPRSGAYDRESRSLTGVPSAVASATIEAARLALSTPLIGGNASAEPQLIRKKTGPLEKEWAKVDGYVAQSNRFALVNALLSSLGMSGGSNSIRIVRA